VPRLLPSADDVSRLLNGLLGKSVNVKKGTPVSPDKVKASVALYRDASGALGAVCVSDLVVAAGAGAALALVPAGVAADSAKEGVLPANLAENWREVLNVASSWFNVAGSHVSLREVLQPADAVPDDAKALLAKPPTRADFEVEIAGYGSGHMTLVSP